MDQPTTPQPDPNELSFTVMPQEGKGSASGFSKESSMPPPPSSSYSAPPSPSDYEPVQSRKWMYVSIAVVVLLGLGAAAYYMLGNKSTNNTQQPASKLSKPWLKQYFSSETCADKNTCGDAADPEKDGLNNYDEFKAGTNPLNPDTDKDGLADGDEVNIYKTEPTIKYTDRREIVAQNDWSDGFQVKNGYDPLTPALKFTDVRKQQIAKDTAEFKLHEPTITTLSQAAAQQVSSKVYTNSQYQFELKYPSNLSAAPVKITTPLNGYKFIAAPAATPFVYSTVNSSWTPSKDAPVVKTTNSTKWFLATFTDSSGSSKVALVPNQSKNLMIEIKISTTGSTSQIAEQTLTDIITTLKFTN